MKLLVFDVDGTLVGENGELPQSTIDSINERLKMGDAIAIASGRPYLGIKQYLDLFVEGKKFAIGANGGATYTFKGEVIDFCALTYKDYLDFFNKYHFLINERNASIYCYTLSNVGYFVLTENTYLESTCNGNIALQDFNKEPINLDEPILKIMVACEQSVLVDVPFKEEKERFHYVDSSSFYHEFVNLNTDKARGVEVLCKMMHICAKDCYCFGDEMNDFQMIKEFNGVAMGNAVEKVKKIAKFITLNQKEDGVSYAIKNYVE